MARPAGTELQSKGSTTKSDTGAKIYSFDMTIKIGSLPGRDPGLVRHRTGSIEWCPEVIAVVDLRWSLCRVARGCKTSRSRWSDFGLGIP